MNTAITASHIPHRPDLLGQNRGRKRGFGLETRRASAEGAKLILTGRNPERLRRAASEVDALGSKAFDATDPVLLGQFFRDLPTPADHIMLTAARLTTADSSTSISPAVRWTSIFHSSSTSPETQLTK